MTRAEFFAKYRVESRSVSRDVKKRADWMLYQMRIQETAYDAIMDYAFPEILTGDRAKDPDYVLRQKMRYHEHFADLCATALENGTPVQLNPALAPWQEDFGRIAKALEKVDRQPMPRYASVVRDIYEVPDPGRAGSIMDQPVLFCAASGEIRSLTPGAIEDHMRAFPGAEAFRFDTGKYEGNFYAASVYSRTAGIFVLRDWAAATEQEPITLSECERVRDEAVRVNPKKALDTDDIFEAWQKVRPRHEGEPVRTAAEFESWCRENGRDFSSQASVQRAMDALRSSGSALGDGESFTYIDLFDKDRDGRRMSASSWAHAFLNDDVVAQARVLGLTPAQAKTANGQVYYVSIEDPGTGVSDDEAYSKEMCAHMGYDAVPVIRLANSKIPHWSQAKLALLDLADGSVSHEGAMAGAMDRLGLSEFRPYLKKEVYAAFEAQVASGQMGDKVVPADVVRNGLAVLQELERRGLDYEVRLDETRGQLAAVIEEPVAVQFRVLDIMNPEFIGRAYYNYTSTITRFNYDGPARRNNNGSMKATPVAMDETMVRDLVAYALGESVPIRSKPGEQIFIDGQSDLTVGQAGRNIQVTSNGFRYRAEKNEKTGGVVRRGVPYNASFVLSKGEGMNALYSVDIREVGASGKLAAFPIRINTQRGKNADAYRAYASADDARDELRQATEMAKDYVRSQADLVMQAEADMDFADAEDIEKVREALSNVAFSEDPYIRSVQQVCVDALLTPEASAAEREGLAIDALNAQLDALGSFSSEGDRIDFANVVKYSGSMETTLLRAMCQSKDEYPIEAVSRNEDATMGRIKERTIRFDPDSARDLLAPGQDPFWAHISDVVRESLVSHGVRVESLEVDENGIIKYQGNRDWCETMTTMEKSVSDAKKARDYSIVSGTIGQVFAPDERGVVVTRFAQGDNYAMVPGYTATVTRGEGSVESRTICKGYQQTLDQKIRAELHQTLSCCNEGDPLNATGLNRLYRHLYDERYPENYAEWFRSMGMDEAMMQATIDTQKGAVRYDKRYIEESTLNARVVASRQSIVDDMNADGYSVTGRDLSVLGWSEDGYFDDSATQASTGQGISRYLVSGASVGPDGRIHKSEVENDKCPILSLPCMDKLHFNPPDRRTMVFSNAMHCFGITENTKTAHMTLQGWTMDDAFVVSKAFAERHMVPDENGELRPMRIGDKICDLNGNKGVISLVVDPEMSMAEAEEKRLTGPVALFRENPGLDVVGSPFTAPSRMNGGTARGMMEQPEDLKLPDGTVVPGGIGSVPYIITDKTVDEKTHIYDDDDIREGKGRSISSQMLWSLQARGASALVSEFFDDNAPNLRTVREKLIAMGMDLDQDYTIVNGYAPHRMPDGTLERRPVLDLPAPDSDLTSEYTAAGVLADPEERKAEKKRVQAESTAEKNEAKAKAVEMVSQTGGFLRLPFSITLANGMETAKAPDGDGYLLPVMPLSFRSQQTYDDDTAIYHNYTRAYRQIAEQAVAYLFERDRPASNPDTHEKNLQGTRAKAQEAYDRMTAEIREVSFDNKWNDWKRRVMSRKMGQSITAVGTPDPRLNLNEVAMSSAMMAHMGVSEGARILLWRDPQLRPEGIAYMKVRLNEDIAGIAMNPSMDKCFDGDFDGDTWGAVPVKTKAAQEEAQRLFGVENKLIDLGPTPDERTPENIVLALNEGLDMASAKAALAARAQDGSEDEAAILRQEALEALASGDNETGYEAINAYVHLRQEAAMGTTVVRYGSMEDHLDSVREMIDSGAKGKVSGLKEYVKWLGVDANIEAGENGAPTKISGIVDYKTPGMHDKEGSQRREMLRNMNTQVNMATAIKSFGTGLAGAVSQKNVGVARKAMKEGGDTYLRYALEVTYGATQGILQAKHDAKEALQKYKVLTDVLPPLYAGNAVEIGPDGSWRGARGGDGNPVRNTKAQFVDQYAALCASKSGLNFSVARDNIERLADCLYDGNANVSGRDTIRKAKDKTMTEVATIDHLAYAGGSFDTVRRMAGRRLFDTPLTREFAPKAQRGSEELASLAARKGAFQVRSDFITERILLGKEAEAAAMSAAAPAPAVQEPVTETPVAAMTVDLTPKTVPAAARHRRKEPALQGAGVRCVIEAEAMTGSGAFEPSYGPAV